MRRLVLIVAASLALALVTAGPAAAQEIGPTPGPTPYLDCPTVGPFPYYVGPSPYYVGYGYAVCEFGGPVFGGPLPQTGTSLALIAGAGVLVMLLGLWAARRRATS